jgi:hypothetical protein
MPGPAPSPNARRTNNQGDWRKLPHRCELPAPDWPLPGRKPAGLVDLWRHLWALPQAVLWHEQGAVRVVARYARLVLNGEKGDATAAEQAVIIRLEDGLLLTPDRLLKARMLVEPAPTDHAPKGDAEVRSLDDARRDRLNGR